MAMKSVMFTDEQIGIVVESLLNSASLFNSDSIALIKAAEMNLGKSNMEFATEQIESAKQLAEKEREVWRMLENIKRSLKR